MITMVRAKHHEAVARAHLDTGTIPNYYILEIDCSKAFRTSQALQDKVDETLEKCSQALVRINESYYNHMAKVELAVQESLQQQARAIYDNGELSRVHKTKLIELWNDSVKVASAAARREHAVCKQRREAAERRAQEWASATQSPCLPQP